MLNLNERETATILAALRLWQKHVEGGRIYDEANLEADIASDEGRLVALTPNEIDDLCERVNIEDDTPCIWLNTGEEKGEIVMHFHVKLVRDLHGSGDPAVTITVEEGETK